MCEIYLSRLFYFSLIISLLMLTLIEGKGISGGRGSSSKGSSRGSGTFGGPSNYNRVNSYGSNVGKPRGSSFKSNAMSFAAGAAGGVAAYALMSSMGSSYRSQRGHYAPGYGVGETCTNNEEFNGTVFGEFRCPLNGFPYEAKYCCGEYGKQFCCLRERSSSFLNRTSHFGWIVLVIIILLVIILLWARRRRQLQKESMMIPTDVPINEQVPPPFYHPPPPPMGYPPPPSGNQYGVPPQHQQGNFNPYGVPSQNQPGNFNPYGQPQPYMPYPPQQQPLNPY